MQSVTDTLQKHQRWQEGRSERGQGGQSPPPTTTNRMLLHTAKK